MRLAAIDLGSNTVKLTVADVTQSGGDVVFDTVAESAEITRIGEGLDDNGQLLPEAIDRTLRVLVAFAGEAGALGAETIGCVATAGLRGASNAGVFLERAQKEAGIDVEIIHGLREAALAYRAPAAMFGSGPLVVVDVGGRSTEIIAGHGAEVTGRVSLEIGGVRLTERFLPTDPPTVEERSQLQTYVRQSLAGAPPAPVDATLVGVSGTVLSLMGVHLGLDDMRRTVAEADGQSLPVTAIEAILERLAAIPAAQRISGSVIPEGRADVIVAGATILLGVCVHYEATAIRVTHRGVRFGLLAEMLERARL